MKICKNNFDIFLVDIPYCLGCSFLIGNNCNWPHTIRRDIPGCGGAKLSNLSDIFTL